jgi:hypothetical protein
MQTWASEVRKFVAPTLICVLLLHIFVFIFERFVDDSPGFGFAILMVGGPSLIALIVLWLVIVLRVGMRRDAAAAIAMLMAPFLSAALLIGLSRVGISPQRVWFEALRPYYLARLWMRPAVDQDRRVEFLWVDKGLWSGHEKLSIIYDPRRDVSDIRSIDAYGQEKVFVHVNDMGQGFYMVRSVTQY